MCDIGPLQCFRQDLPFFCILTMVKIRLFSNNIRSSPMIELMTSTKDWGLSINILRLVVPRRGSLPGFFISFTPHVTCFIIRAFWFTITRHQKVYLHITHTYYRPLAEQCHDCNWRKTERLSEWVVSLLQSYGSKNRGSGQVCFFVTWDPNILHQVVDNLKVISESDQLTNACVWHRIRRHRKMWLVNNTWESNHIFLCHRMTKC
jgi:hypothetical protein